jgi:hypothetical protein
MKAMTAIAAATLFLGVTAASAQTLSSSANKPGATVNTNTDVSAAGTSKAKHAKSTSKSSKSMTRRSTTGAGSSTTGSGSSTTGSGSSEPPGVTPGSNPNPSWNQNPDPEVPGNTLE